MASVTVTGLIVRGLGNMKMLYVMDDGSYGELWPQGPSIATVGQAGGR